MIGPLGVRPQGLPLLIRRRADAANCRSTVVRCVGSGLCHAYTAPHGNTSQGFEGPYRVPALHPVATRITSPEVTRRTRTDTPSRQALRPPLHPPRARTHLRSLTAFNTTTTRLSSTARPGFLDVERAKKWRQTGKDPCRLHDRQQA